MNATKVDGSILCEPALYNMNDPKQIPRAVNIDMAAIASKDPELRTKLKAAINQNKVDQMSTYKIGGQSMRNSTSDLDKFYDAFEKADATKQKEILNTLTKKAKQ